MALAPKGRAFIRSREQHASRKPLRLSTLILFSAIAFLLVLVPFRSNISSVPSDDGGAFSGVLGRNRNNKNRDQRVGSPAWQQMMDSLKELGAVDGEGKEKNDDKVVGVVASVRGEEGGRASNVHGGGDVEHDSVSKGGMGTGEKAQGGGVGDGGGDVGPGDANVADVVQRGDKAQFVEERDLMSGLDEKMKREQQRKLSVGNVEDAKPATADAPACLQHIIYDKPVKTGSTAVTVALQDYLTRRGEEFVDCTFESCGKAAREVCDGKRAKTHFVEHISPEDGLLDCLSRLGYYRVTSVREPLDRWESAFLYNRKQKATHYGIAFNESYARFMELYPDCSLFDYYDGLGKSCEAAKIGVEERVHRIVNRYEEIIDLYHDEEKGQLHRLLANGLNEENRSPRPNGEFRQWFDKKRLDPEIRLYNAFKARQRELVGKEPKLC